MLPSERYDSLIRYWAEAAGLDFTLIKRQLVAESALNPEARSPVGASGLAQFMPATWREVLAKNNWPDVPPTHPEYAIRGMCAYMKTLLARFNNNYRLALAAYNWGQGNVAKRPDADSWPKETRDYVARIMP